MSMAEDEFNSQWLNGWPKVVAKAWNDPAYAQQLKDDPAAVLAAAGLPMLNNISVEVVDGAAHAPKMTLFLPPKPSDAGGDVEGDAGHATATQTSCCC